MDLMGRQLRSGKVVDGVFPPSLSFPLARVVFPCRPVIFHLSKSHTTYSACACSARSETDTDPAAAGISKPDSGETDDLPRSFRAVGLFQGPQCCREAYVRISE